MSEFPDCILIRFHVNYAILSWGTGRAARWPGAGIKEGPRCAVVSERSSQSLGCSVAPHLPQAHGAKVCPEGAPEVMAKGRNWGELASKSEAPAEQATPTLGQWLLGCHRPTETRDLLSLQEMPETRAFMGRPPIFKKRRQIQVSKRRDAGQE